MVALTGGLRAPFARYWLSGFLADFGDGVRLAAFPLLAAQLMAVAALRGISVGSIGPRVARRAGPWRSLLAAGAVMAASQAGLGLTTNVIVAAVMLFASSAAWALFNMTAVTMRQRQVLAGLLGRITSLNGTVAGGAEALGALAGGALLPPLAGYAPPCSSAPCRSLRR